MSLCMYLCATNCSLRCEFSIRKYQPNVLLAFAYMPKIPRTTRTIHHQTAVECIYSFLCILYFGFSFVCISMRQQMHTLKIKKKKYVTSFAYKILWGPMFSISIFVIFSSHPDVIEKKWQMASACSAQSNDAQLYVVFFSFRCLYSNWIETSILTFTNKHTHIHNLYRHVACLNGIRDYPFTFTYIYICSFFQLLLLFVYSAADIINSVANIATS